MALAASAAAVGAVATACGSSGDGSADAARVADDSALDRERARAAPGDGDGGDGGDGGAPGPHAGAAPGAREEHAVFSLGANRLLAHAHRGDAMFVDAGSAGFAKYVRFGVPVLRWKLQRLVDAVKVAIPDRLAAIEVPLSAEQAAEIETLHIRVHSPARRRLTVKINGRKAGGGASVTLEPGWQTAAIPIARGRLAPGENFVALELGRGKPAAVAWLQLGGEPPPDAPATRPAGPALYDADDDAFEIEDGGGLTYYVHVPEGAHLVASVTDAGRGARSGEASRGARCAVRVRARGAGAALAGALQARRVMPDADDTAAPRGAPDRVADRVDLAALAGQVVRLELTAIGCDLARVRGAALTVPGPAPVYERPDVDPPRYILLWVMDALRADRVRPLSPGARAEVPGFERLASTGAVFRQYYVQGNESQTSHASVWTGLYPAVHGVRTAGNNKKFKIDDGHDKLGELIRGLGFYTIGVTANGYVTRGGGYGKGFDVWRNPMREGRARRNAIPGAVLYNLAIGLLAQRLAGGAAGRSGRASGPDGDGGAAADAPAPEAIPAPGPDAARAFVFLGTIDTHLPWVGHEPWLSRYDPGPYDGPHVDAAWPGNLGIVRGSMKCTDVPKPRDIQRISAIYDSAVSYQDQLLATLIAQLAEWRILDQTMILVTADHGEELWEDGRCGHGASLRESLVRVPLLVHYPPLIPGGVVVTEGVEGVDILPTILDALGQEPLAQAQGASLIPLTRGVGRGYVRPSYASQYEYAHTMRLGDWKLRVGRTGVAQLYNVAIDPHERKDLSRALPAERRLLADAMSLFLLNRARWDKRAWGVASNMTGAGADALDRVEAE